MMDEELFIALNEETHDEVQRETENDSENN